MLIKHLLYKNHNGITTIILKCPDCGTWGHLKKHKHKLLVHHKTKTGHSEHRIHGGLFEEMRNVFLEYRGKLR